MRIFNFYFPRVVRALVDARSNRQSPNIAHVITSTISAHMPHLVKITQGVTSPHIAKFTTHFFFISFFLALYAKSFHGPIALAVDGVEPIVTCDTPTDGYSWRVCLLGVRTQYFHNFTLKISSTFSPSDSHTIPVFFQTERYGNIPTRTPNWGKNRTF